MKSALSLVVLIIAFGAATQSKSSADIETLLPAETMLIARSAILTGSFVQTRTLKDLRQPLRSSGHFVYARDHGVIWSVQQPFTEEFIFSNDHVRISGGGSQPQIGNEVPRLLTALFTLDFAELEHNFELSAERRKSDWSLQLTPRQRALATALREVRLEGQRHLQRVMLVDGDGNKTRIELKNLRVLKTLPAATQQRFQ